MSTAEHRRARTGLGQGGRAGLQARSLRTPWATDQRLAPHLAAQGAANGTQVADRRPQIDSQDDGLRVTAGLAAERVSRADQLFVRRTLQVLLVIVVAGQRLVLPLGGFPISLSLVAVYVALLVLRTRDGVRYNRVRTELYLAAAAGVLAATWFASLLERALSVNSLLLLLILYLPWVFCVSRPYLDQVVPVLRTFTNLMVLLGMVGVGQMGAQLVLGWQYTDYLQDLLGPELIAQGFNTRNQISYFDPTVKANAFVMLEPSFLCQFLALALLVALLLREPAWKPLLLGLGMAATLSGTGILLLVVGVTVMILRVPSLIRPGYVIAGVVGLAVVFATPAADILLERRTETTEQGSSGYLRFVQPYQEVGEGLAKDPVRYLLGAGAGSSDRLLESDRGGGEAVVYSIAPKLAFEYGLVAAFAFITFLLISILRGPPMAVLPSSIIFMIFFLSGSLLQPHTILTAWLLTSIWGNPVTVGVTDALAALRRLRSQVSGALPRLASRRS